MAFSISGQRDDVKRAFGAGDLAVLIGGLLTIVPVIVLLSKYLGRYKFDALAGSLGILLGLIIFVIVAEILSLNDEKWLLVSYGWCCFVAIMFIGRVATVSSVPERVAPGTDFFILLGALLIGAGAYMSQQRIGLWQAPQTAGANIEQQLEQLKEMFDKGLITEADYTKKRQDLIGRI